jgi:hypothetical protein
MSEALKLTLKAAPPGPGAEGGFLFLCSARPRVVQHATL